MQCGRLIDGSGIPPWCHSPDTLNCQRASVSAPGRMLQTAHRTYIATVPAFSKHIERMTPDTKRRGLQAGSSAVFSLMVPSPPIGTLFQQFEFTPKSRVVWRSAPSLLEQICTSSSNKVETMERAISRKPSGK